MLQGETKVSAGAESSLFLLGGARSQGGERAEALRKFPG
jgi:hypothetical protein